MGQPEPVGAGAALPLRHAIALGLLHGPAELLPISSSGHITLIPWLAGWPYDNVEAELRKSFEIALHAGTAAALLITQRDEVATAVHELNGRRVLLILFSFVPPAVAGFTLQDRIEGHLGTPATIAAGLLIGSAAMTLADRRGARTRRREDAGALDGLALGLAQACALIPGISRNGATLTAARLRGFPAADANVLSRHCALPIILGAVALKGKTLTSGDSNPIGRQLLGGALAAFGSTLASSWLISRLERERSLAPYAVYRTTLAALVIRRLRHNHS